MNLKCIRTNNTSFQGIFLINYLCLDTQCVIVGGLSMELCGVPGDAAIIQEQVTGLALCIHNMEQHPTWFSCRNFLVKKLSGERSSTNVSGNSLLEM